MKARQFYLSMACIGLSFAASNALGQTDNTSFGTGAGASITSGDYNTMIGDSAGTTLSSGHYNVIIGHDAGKVLRSGSDNVLIGDEA
ncbi:MAG: hemagluttinin family protein, partial [Salibacteraceae bacterium]